MSLGFDFPGIVQELEAADLPKAAAVSDPFDVGGSLVRPRLM
jgi:hypothetical protein